MLQLRVRSRAGEWSTESFIEGFCEICLHVGYIRQESDKRLTKCGYCNKCFEGLNFERNGTKI